MTSRTCKLLSLSEEMVPISLVYYYYVCCELCLCSSMHDYISCALVCRKNQAQGALQLATSIPVEYPFGTTRGGIPNHRLEAENNHKHNPQQPQLLKQSWWRQPPRIIIKPQPNGRINATRCKSTKQMH